MLLTVGATSDIRLNLRHRTVEYSFAPQAAECRILRVDPFSATRYDPIVTRLRLLNETGATLGVWLEPLGEDFWIAPSQTLIVAGANGEHEVECVWHPQGVSVFMTDADPHGFTVCTESGEVVECGYQRPASSGTSAAGHNPA